MSVELMVWRAPSVVSRERASALWRDARTAPPATPQDEGLAELAGEVGEAATGFAGHVLVTMTPEEADELSNRVFALAAGHGLTVYDPPRDLVHNRSPLGAYLGMQLHTGDGMVITDPDLGLVHDVLATLSAQNPFAALVVFGSHFIQVSPGYELEYKEGALVRTDVEDLAEIRRAFTEYAEGARDFLTRHAWTAVRR
jgi:hypothetical protein